MLFSGFNKMICKGERIVLTGPNGSGKTTLMQMHGGIAPCRCRADSVCTAAKIAYLDQEVELLPMEKTPLQYFESRFNLSEEDLRSELHKACIGGADLLGRPFSTLKRRAKKAAHAPLFDLREAQCPLVG